MLVLILIEVQYLQKIVFSFEKDLNGQSHIPTTISEDSPCKISHCLGFSNSREK